MSVAGFDPHSQKMLCSRFLSSGQWDRALDAAREWLAQEPQNARAHLAAAHALINLKRHAEAEPHLQQVLSLEPNNDVALRFLSIIQFAQKRDREADETMQRAIALDPNDFHHWHHLASMSYQRGDLASTGKYAAKARELNPRDANIINLLALSMPHSPALAQERLERYQEALELNPESPEVHNNLGVYYLNYAKDYQKAEESFRRALYFAPGLKVARANLFLVLKKRDRIYSWLRAPKDFVMRGFSFIGQQRRKNLLLYLLLLPLWFVAFRYLLGGLLLWCLLVWPMVKVYEALTIGDLQHQAGEIGARRGGLLGYRRWPLRVRLGIFGGLLLLFWCGLAWAIYYVAGSAPASQNFAWGLFGLGMFAGAILLAFNSVRRTIHKRRIQLQARRRGRRFDQFLGNKTKVRRRRRFWRRPADS